MADFNDLDRRQLYIDAGCTIEAGPLHRGEVYDEFGWWGTWDDNTVHDEMPKSMWPDWYRKILEKPSLGEIEEAADRALEKKFEKKLDASRGAQDRISYFLCGPSRQWFASHPRKVVRKPPYQKLSGIWSGEARRDRTEGRDRLICQLKEEGMSHREIAKEVGLSRGGVEHVLRREGLLKSLKERRKQRNN